LYTPKNEFFIDIDFHERMVGTEGSVVTEKEERSLPGEPDAQQPALDEKAEAFAQAFNPCGGCEHQERCMTDFPHCFNGR
jgi:hypothetical protein